MISVDSISVIFGHFELLSNISFLVNPKERIGLTGRNGSGKTTLLKIINGSVKPSSGRVVIPSGVTTGYLPQQIRVSDSTTIFNETLKSFSHLEDIRNEVDSITGELAKRSDFETPSYIEKCDSLALLEEQFRLNGGDIYIAETEQALTGLGFDRRDFRRGTSELSGGWRMRIELAKILLKKPDLLLLDEPTNHLDIESIQWFEYFLKKYHGSIILVSHDRAFLDNVTGRTIELSLSRAYDYKASYSTYLELRRERRDQQLAAFRNQQKVIEDTERFIERFRYKNTKAVQVQSRIKKLEKLERIEVDKEDGAKIKISFPPSPRSGRVAIEAQDISKSFGSTDVLNSVSIIIERGEKVAFVGRNGEGKTTFTRIVAGELDFKGKLIRGHNIKTGYYAQNQDELLDETLTVFQTIDTIATGDLRTKVRDILGAFLFSGDDIDKKVKVLSGGERSRLAIIKLLLEPFNLLLLDEPTNHLDIQSKAILKDALLNYDGTLIVVSHDRDFLDGLVDKVYEFREKQIKENIGGIYDFLRKRQIDNLREIEKKENEELGAGVKDERISKKEYLDRKDQERNIRKLRKSLQIVEEKIDQLEKEKNILEDKMSKPDEKEVLDNDTIFIEYESLKRELDKKTNEWEDILSALDSLEKEI